MRIARKIAELEIDRSGDVGFVPTMGAFHEGHLSLMRSARTENRQIVVSLFVNPLQFGAGEDFERYPKNLDRDAALAKNEGVDILFSPPVDEIYPRESTKIVVPEVSRRWEGAFRPGHFAGVATVVAKLFNIVQPTTAYFGWKDLQQCLVIRRMVEDLNMPVQLSFQDTVRESDGLAMSSRNQYLSAEERARAPHLYRELSRCKDVLLSGSTNHKVELFRSVQSLESEGFEVDYFELVSLKDLEPLSEYLSPAAIVSAVKLGKTRLIDNVLLI